MKLGLDKKAAGCLFSRIQLEARLLTRISTARKEMESYPGLRLVRDGTSLLYEIKCDEKSEHFYSLELDREHISITIYSQQNPTFFMQEAMLRLLGILQILSRSYEVRMGSLYPYLVLTLANQQLGRLAHVEAREEAAPELILARKLISLMRENTRLREDYYKTFGRMRKVLLGAAAISGRRDNSVEEIASSLGIDKKEVIAALACARESGYRVVHTGNDTFSLVRI